MEVESLKKFSSKSKTFWREPCKHLWVTQLRPEFNFVLFSDGESLFSALSSEEFKSEKNHLPNSHKWKGGDCNK